MGSTTDRPQLRPVEAFDVPGEGDGLIGLRDPSGLSQVILSMSPAALHVLSLMDGTRTRAEICAAFLGGVGQRLPVETLDDLIRQLDAACLLQGETFEAHYRSLLDDYRRAGRREMPHAKGLGILDDSGDLFEAMLASAESVALPGPVLGLVAPHLDYPRGGPCYGSAYATLRGRPAPDRIVVLGTNHFGRATSVVATGNDFSTPLGTTAIDLDFLQRMEERCGDLREWEFDHMGEHSIELQVAWLQHLFGPRSFELVPFLCHDPCGPTGMTPRDGHGIDLNVFSMALGELVDDDGADTLIVAGADLSHVGAAFGDERRLDDAYLDQVRKVDTEALDRLADHDPGALVRRLAEQDNVTRVCSAGCIFALATALPHGTARVLRYHQAVDQPSQTCVTCAAVAYT